MAQWDRLMGLPDAYTQQLHELYNRDALPMDVRHYLSVWIEKQEWERAAHDYDLAMALFQVLLENLDIQHSRFVQEESFLMKHNIRRYKQNFQRYLDDPCGLANTILWFLGKEKEILKSADLVEQVECLHVAPEAMEMTSQQDLERKLSGLRNEVQSTLSDLNKLLNKTDDLIDILVKKELVEWQRRQQKACIGAPDNVLLDQLEKWFTCVAGYLFQVREFFGKLDELVEKLTYENDPVKAQKPTMQKRAETLLKDLLKSSFVVETQPSMPQGKGPLVLRTNVQFSVKTRLLVKFPELNHSMKVSVSMDREAPQIKGYRRFNVLGTKSKALNMAESQNGGMVADFRHLTLKEQKAGGGGKGVSDISLSVTEELHIIYFDTVFEMKGVSVELQASSIPVVIISNSSQQQSAWASVLWFNLLRQQQKYDTCKVTWSKFSKENTPDTFWVWLDGILVLVKTYLEDLWRDGLIMGFVNKGKEKSLLKKKQRGTFLLRFSESVIGGITFSWVEITITGAPGVKTVRPFTKADLCQIPFHEIIRGYQILEAENIPENPLLYLYPNTPKDEAFGKYYSEKTGSDRKYIRTKLVFVSKEDTLEAKSPMSFDMTRGEGLEPMNSLCEEAAEQNQSPASPLETFHPDPMLSDSFAATDDELLRFLNSPNSFDDSGSDILQDEAGLLDCGLTGYNCLPQQSCGSIFQ
ncbi:Signal transducer and activator of transcription 3 [Liparis tanakae]|uniref:Signal transducer and activator of transcription n=1 Tax=Liparis tanakae TaxID=230148 RepID=A0A4Z2IUC3_9TELE|nr:Signal transducer and activator of transcription 3 [Liparis tanakae]